MKRTKIITAVTAVFTIAAAVGSTLLTPEQREAVLSVLPTILAIFGP